MLASYEDPSGTYLFLKNNDSDVKDDDLSDPARGYCTEIRLDHVGGLHVTYIDFHAKWMKAVFRNNNPCVNANWVQPPTGGGGKSGDCGPWTAPANDPGP